MLLIMIPDQYPNNYKALETYTAYFDRLEEVTDDRVVRAGVSVT